MTTRLQETLDHLDTLETIEHTPHELEIARLNVIDAARAIESHLESVTDALKTYEEAQDGDSNDAEIQAGLDFADEVRTALELAEFE